MTAEKKELSKKEMEATKGGFTITKPVYQKGVDSPVDKFGTSAEGGDSNIYDAPKTRQRHTSFYAFLNHYYSAIRLTKTLATSVPGPFRTLYTDVVISTIVEKSGDALALSYSSHVLPLSQKPRVPLSIVFAHAQLEQHLHNDDKSDVVLKKIKAIVDEVRKQA